MQHWEQNNNLVQNAGLDFMFYKLLCLVFFLINTGSNNYSNKPRETKHTVNLLLSVSIFPILSGASVILKNFPLDVIKVLSFWFWEFVRNSTVSLSAAFLQSLFLFSCR